MSNTLQKELSYRIRRLATDAEQLKYSTQYMYWDNKADKWTATGRYINPKEILSTIPYMFDLGNSPTGFSEDFKIVEYYMIENKSIDPHKFNDQYGRKPIIQKAISPFTK